ncbi:MAG: hypothetical protein M1165_02730 [Candidatus Pacearchaeota archaeon]|nr:hypothetical protein [Candidatus Pacearchaeota archaeon]
MAFIVKKKIHGREYYYLNENKRVDGKVKTKTLAYLGKDRQEAEIKKREFMDSRITEAVNGNGGDEPPGMKISIEELGTFCKRKGSINVWAAGG